MAVIVLLMHFNWQTHFYKYSKYRTLAFLIEIAVTDFTTTKSAVEGGAGRIELCSALSEGGLTPSYGLVKACRENFDLPLFPIVRPRGGDFLYSDEEFQIMQQEIGLFKKMGCDGVVIGFLKGDGSIDYDRTAQLVELAYPMEVTFHRAFDRCAEPFKAMEQIIKAGCQRILTSGQKPNVMDGIELVKQLVQTADERIIILPGSGVRKENIKEVAQKTGATEFHSSLRSEVKSSMEFIHPAFEGSAESYINPAIDPQEVRLLKAALQNL